MSQESGLVGQIVGAMIRRSVRRRFRCIRWRTDATVLRSPTILYANHHGWMDGYLMFHLVAKLGLRCVDWIEEYDSFPLFSSVGGMRFAKGDIAGRVSTIRETIRLMNHCGRSLVIFPEQQLHRPPLLLPFGRAIGLIAQKVPAATMAPVAIYYELSLHERPEAWMWVGQSHVFDSLESCQNRLESQLTNLRQAVSGDVSFEVLAPGTPDVNERLDMRRIPKR